MVQGEDYAESRVDNKQFWNLFRKFLPHLSALVQTTKAPNKLKLI